MKIEYVKGDLFSVTDSPIIHGCNNQGVMGSGVARIMRDLYPRVYYQYRSWYEDSQKTPMGPIAAHLGAMEVGKYQIVSRLFPEKTDGEDTFHVINAITQDFFGRDGRVFVKYDAIERIFTALNDEVEPRNWKTISMPLIGAGLGGGDWNRISEIIERSATKYQPMVYQL